MQPGVSLMEVVIFKVICSICFSNLKQACSFYQIPYLFAAVESQKSNSFTFLSYVKQHDMMTSDPHSPPKLFPPGRSLHNTSFLYWLRCAKLEG